MSFQPAGELTTSAYLRMLLMGPAKSGKTTSCLTTSPGPVGLVLCERDSATNEAKRQSAQFSFIRCLGGWNDATKMLGDVRAAVKANEIKTLIIDPFTNVAYQIEQEMLQATNQDGRRAYPIYKQRLFHILSNLFQLPIHIIAVCHYFETDADKEDDKGKRRSGKGKAPMFSGSAREKVAAEFDDIVWHEVRQDEPVGRVGKDGIKRVFVTGPEGIWTTGGARSLQGTHVLPADVGVLIKTIKDESKRPPTVNVATKANGAARPVVQAPVRQAAARTGR